MAFQKLFEISTRETIAVNKRVAQVIPVPTGRLDKVLLSLAGEIDPALTGQETFVVVEIHAVNQQLIPSGIPIISDSKTIKEIEDPGFYNFSLPADVPTTVAVVVRIDGDQRSQAFWTYVSVDEDDAPMAVDAEGNGQWQQDFSRKMTFVAYSLLPNAIVLDDDTPNISPGFDSTDVSPDTNTDIIQSALIQPGTEETFLDDTRDDFRAMDIDRGVVLGDTVAIEFGNYVITMVVDQSGSMTWNDHGGLRFDFLKEFADDIADSLDASNRAATHSLSVGTRSDRRVWSSIIHWDSGFVELSPGVDYDARMTVDGQLVTVMVFSGATLVGTFSKTMPDPLSDLGAMDQFLLGRDSGDDSDGSLISLTLMEARADTKAPDETIFLDTLASDAGWDFTDPGNAVFTGGALALTANSGTNQIGSRAMSKAVGSNFVISSKFRIDAAAEHYNMLVGIASGRATGEDNRPGGIWMEIGFEKANISDVKFSILKFRGRKLSRIRLVLNEGEQGEFLEKIVLARDGVTIHEGLDELFIDRGDEGVPLVPGVSHVYSIRAVDETGNSSEVKTVIAASATSPVFPVGLAGFRATEEIVKDSDLDVGKRRINLTWTHAEVDDPDTLYDRLFIVRRDDRFPESDLDGTVVLDALRGEPAFDAPFVDFADPGFDESTYPTNGLTFFYRAFTEKANGIRTRLPNARKASVAITISDKPWERDLVPVPPSYDPTPPAAPTGFVVVPGNQALSLSWDAVATARRYEIFVGEFEAPVVGIDPETGRKIFTTRLSNDGIPQVINPIFNGSATEFVHRELQNFEPHHYVIVAYDAVSNVSPDSGVLGRPDPEADDVIAPDAPTEFSAEPLNTSSVTLTWDLPLPDSTSVNAFFGDTVTAIAIATFEDDVDSNTLSVLEVRDTERSVVGFNTDDLPDDIVIAAVGSDTFSSYEDKRVDAETEPEPQNPDSLQATSELDDLAKARTDDTEVIDPADIELAQPQEVEVSGSVVLDPNDGSISVSPLATIDVSSGASESGTTTMAVSMTENLTLLNLMESALVEVESGLFVRDSAGETVASVFGGAGTIRFSNPLEVSIIDDPPRRVNRRVAFKQNCCCSPDDDCGVLTDPIGCADEIALGWECDEVVGTFAIIGEPLAFTIEAKFRGQPVIDPLRLAIRLLDANTENPSTIAKLEGSDEDGILVVEATQQARDILDRAGEPSGFQEVKSLSQVIVPSQTIPGDYLLEVVTELNLFSRRATFPVHFEHPLNIDVISKPFIANGVDVAEQMARVYLGDPLAENANKIPIEDGTVVKWSIEPGSTFSKSRPFFSRSDIVGTGIKSATQDGIAREIFLGPGTDIEPFECGAEEEPCTDFEWYVLSAEVEALGINKTGFGVILETAFVSPFNESGLNRIFLRPVAGGTPGFSRDVISSDGITESLWEVVAVPREDGSVGDTRSGAYFHDRITSIGGLVPDLPDGTVVSMYVSPYFGDASFGISATTDQRKTILAAGKPEMKTDLTNGQFIEANFARATILNGKAEFRIRLNAFAVGARLELPLEEEIENIIYGNPPLWIPRPLVFSLTATTSLPVRGKTIAFFGGGNDFSGSTPPCWLSFEEPLAPLGEVTAVDEADTGSQGP